MLVNLTQSVTFSLNFLSLYWTDIFHTCVLFKWPAWNNKVRSCCGEVRWAFFSSSSAYCSFSMVSLLSFNNSSSVLLSTSPWPCRGQGKYVRKRREEGLLEHTTWLDLFGPFFFLCESCLCDQCFLLLLQILNCSKQNNSKKKWNQKHVSSFSQKDSATLLVHLRNAFFRRKSHWDFLF